MVGNHELLLTLRHQTLEATDPLPTGNEFALGNSDLLLELCVLLHELPLHKRKLLEVALEERELLLLLLAVGAAQDAVVLLAGRVEGDLELDDALAAVLHVAHERLLDLVEVGELLVHRSAVTAGNGLLA